MSIEFFAIMLKSISVAIGVFIVGCFLFFIMFGITNLIIKVWPKLYVKLFFKVLEYRLFNWWQTIDHPGGKLELSFKDKNLGPIKVTFEQTQKTTTDTKGMC